MARIVRVYPFEAVSPVNRDILISIIDSLGFDEIPLVLDKNSIYNDKHLASGIMHAARALVRGHTRAKDPSMEIIRWIAGVHQVSAGVRMVSPSKETERVLICRLPGDWPNAEDELELPGITVCKWDGKELPSLSPLDEKDPFGGKLAFERLGMSSGLGLTWEQAEMAVMERVCSPTLR